MVRRRKRVMMVARGARFIYPARRLITAGDRNRSKGPAFCTPCFPSSTPPLWYFAPLASSLDVSEVLKSLVSFDQWRDCDECTNRIYLLVNCLCIFIR